MTNDERNPTNAARNNWRLGLLFRASCFVLLSSFVIRISTQSDFCNNLRRGTMNWKISLLPGWILAFLFIPLVVGGGTNKTEPLPPSERPATWAVPLSKPGLPNFYQVSPILFRGAQPSHEGML